MLCLAVVGTVILEIKPKIIKGSFRRYWHKRVNPFNAKATFIQSTKMQIFLKTN